MSDKLKRVSNKMIDFSMEPIVVLGVIGAIALFFLGIMKMYGGMRD